MNYTGILALTAISGMGFGAAALAGPSDLYGTWVSLDQQCLYEGGIPSSAAFTISRSKLEYFETSCDVIGTPQVGHDQYSMSYTVRCTNGMTKTTHFALGADDRLTVTDNGYTYTAKRCP